MSHLRRLGFALVAGGLYGSLAGERELGVIVALLAAVCAYRAWWLEAKND